MITLTFHPERGATTILVRGTYFRICADQTLRGPDNDIAASYSDYIWRLALRECRAFECDSPVYLRVRGREGPFHSIGPYEFLRVKEGAIFTHDMRLGVHAPNERLGRLLEVWHEIVLLRPNPVSVRR
ncbi:MAG TPA: hypothetical protein VMU40_09885 [Steroidobacteraceae bacterium]|nr:hypothetical protein [Steroidobacteraceae bacterium]